ncbi:hypothetical protein OG562_43165 [Streptomyces sp. NBC_01275]|uniref:hypothetical protein n=1 Tax=Streptomyces sp. NBC_01275 TaxID=2903807 RepID=UPI002258E641|nr:hypothetical protein [Streptomyces sp. NBC_01275]MCX4767641.1 hypothetical protein [Streptomyces sp. NBC_01275]
MIALLGMAILLVSPVWLLAVLFKLVSVALPGRRPDWAVNLLRWSAWMAAVGAVDLYLMAAGAVGFAVHESQSGADSSPAPACREDVAPDTVRRLVGHRASYLPPAFDCVLDDGTTYTSSGGYATANTLVVVLAGGSGALALAARSTAERRAREQETAGPGTDPAPAPAPAPGE